MKLACWGFYGYDSLGDELLMGNLVERLMRRGIAPGCITLFCREPQIPPDTVAGIQFCARTATQIMKQACAADVFIIGPGGLFPVRNSGKLLLFALGGAILRLRGKKMIFLGVGISSCNFESTLDLWFVRQMFRLADDVILRCQIKGKVPPWVLQNAPVKETVDMMFMPQALPPPLEIAPATPYIIIALVNDFTAAEAEARHTLVVQMCKTIQHILAQGRRVYLMPFSKTKDTLLQREIAAMVHSGDCVSLDYNTDIPAVTNLFASAHYVLSMRFHAVVLALRYAVPVYALSYNDKIDDLMGRFELEDLLLPYRGGAGRADAYTISAQTMIAQCDKIETEYAKIKERILQKLPQIQEMTKIYQDVIEAV